MAWHAGMPFIFDWHGMAWHGMFWVDGGGGSMACWHVLGWWGVAWHGMACFGLTAVNPKHAMSYHAMSLLPRKVKMRRIASHVRRNASQNARFRGSNASHATRRVAKVVFCQGGLFFATHCVTLRRIATHCVALHRNIVVFIFFYD